MTTPMIRLWYAVTALVVACFIVAAVSVQYANYVDRKSNQRWCELLSTLDEAYRATPPRTEPGKKVAEDIVRLRQEFGCGTAANPRG